MSTCSLYTYQVRLLIVFSRFLVCIVRSFTDRFLAPGSSDSQLYFVCVELVTLAGPTPFVLMSKSAATSGQTVSRELHWQSFFPAQKGHPAFLSEVRLLARACQLCTLPIGHSWHCHQMSLPLCNVVLSGKLPYLLFLS